MAINADFAARAAVHAGRMPWVPSPTAGVERRMLDRVGGEVARATSLVRYAPGSRFPEHVHGGGEEFLVLEGVFSDETGDMPAGTYVRNPPGTAHAPAPATGCVILVKLWQFDPTDRVPVRIGTADLTFGRVAGRPDVRRAVLHRDEIEEVRLERWSGGAKVELDLPRGGEFFVITGGFEEAGERFGRWSWLRLPIGYSLSAVADAQGCELWIKTGQFRNGLRYPGDAA